MLACFAMVLVAGDGEGDTVPRFHPSNAGLPLTVGVCVSAGGIARITFAIYKAPSSSHNNTVAILQHGTTLLVYSLVQWIGFLCMFQTRSEHEGIRMVPRTGYSIREIDQAVALGIGISTLLLSIYELIRNWGFSVDDEFEEWRRRCIKDIDLGSTDVEIARRRCGLDRIDKRMKCARTRARHRKREAKARHGLPLVVRRYVINKDEMDRIMRICCS